MSTSHVLRTTQLSQAALLVLVLLLGMQACTCTSPGAAPADTASIAQLTHETGATAGFGRTLSVSAGTQSPARLPFRIHTEYQSLQGVSNSSQALLQLLVEEATQLLSRHLSVKNPSGALLLAPPICQSGYAYKCDQWYPDFQSASPGMKSCGSATINPEHVLSYTPACAFNSQRGAEVPCPSVAGGFGYDTDYYLYITALDVCSSGAASTALPCLFDPSSNRPLMGAVNICPKFLVAADPHNLLGVILHEMIHTLGFIDSMLGFFVDSQGNALPRSQVLRTTQVGGQAVQQITTPKVVQEVRAHFNCPTLQGAQLEVLGGASSTGSHWEYTLFQGEVMVASTRFSAQGDSPRLTRLTLALLDDSGWYLSNYTGAAPLTWGKNAGCDFAELSCLEYSDRYPDNRYFCKLGADSGAAQAFPCTPSLKSQGTCTNVSFIDASCGVMVPRQAPRSCLTPALQYGNADVFGWYNGASSRCIESSHELVARSGDRTYTFTGSRTLTNYEATCFPMHCENGGLFIDILGRSLRCSSGSILDLSVLLPDTYSSGTLGPCPDNVLACSTLECQNCSAGGDCLEGQCFCMLGFSGADCALDAITGLRLAGPITHTRDQSSPSSDASVSKLQVAVITVCSVVGLLAITAIVTMLAMHTKATTWKARVATSQPT